MYIHTYVCIFTHSSLMSIEVSQNRVILTEVVNLIDIHIIVESILQHCKTVLLLFQ